MTDGIFVSGTISGIEFVYAGAIYMAGNATNWPFKPMLYVFKYKCYPMKMLNIAFQIRNMRRLFWHSFRHWSKFFWGNLQDQKCKKWSFLPIYDVFKYRWHLIEMPDNAYRMQDVRWVFSIVSGIDLMDAGAISVPEMPKKGPFMPVFFVFKYKMVSKEDAGYCIPDARCETSFRHSFRHWFNLFRGNWQDQNRKKWSFIPIYDLF